MTLEIDRGTKQKLFDVYPDLREKAFSLIQDVYTDTGRAIRVTEAFRSFSYQNSLFAKGRTEAGVIITWARGGESYHNFGVAFDVCFVGSDPYLSKERDERLVWDRLGEIGKKNGLHWGGLFPMGKRDLPHFEISYGLSVRDMDKIHNESGIEGLWKRFDKIRGVPEGESWNVSVNPKS